MKHTIYASWAVRALPADLDEFHVSCGIGDGQEVGFFPSDRGAVLTIMRTRAFYVVTLKAPCTARFAKHKDRWLSPNPVEGFESGAFGIKTT